MTHRHIYCIEGNWNAHPRSRQSIRPILDLLHDSCGIKYVYRRATTKAEFLEALRQYTFCRYDNYPILYICYHGQPNGICIGREFVTLAEIADVLEGCLTDCIIHFGSCSTLRVKRLVIDDFLTKTGAAIVTGYRRQVDFVDSSAWEMIWLQSLQRNLSSQTKGLPQLAEDLSFTVRHK